MSAPIRLPEDAPFTAPQKSALHSLLEDLSPAQAAWLSGYMAAIGQLSDKGGAPAARAGGIPLTILFGSESGNAEGCAREAARAAERAGFQPTVVDMGDCDPMRLPLMRNLLVIVSTWGEGDPPERAAPFHAAVMGPQAPALPGVRFAVFALGDVSYKNFCECGKQFDRRLAELGATRVLERVDADVAYEEPFQRWLGAVLPRFKEAAGHAPSVTVVAPPAPARAAAPAEPYGKKNPFPAPVKAVINLNGRGSAKLTCHVELSLAGSGLAYKPGDVAGVFPSNCPEVVEDFLRLAGLDGAAPVAGEDGLPLREVLKNRYDITTLNVPLLRKYAPLARNPRLDAALAEDNKDSLAEWLHGREMRDLFAEFPPAAPLGADAVLGLLRRMAPRLYSIASSLRAHPDELHLTVGAVIYEAHGRLRKGVCSTYLCQRVAVGDTVPLYTHTNKNFALPESGDTPIIMVGPGTGIAPFRAFIEERAATGATGKSWLFFGDQHFNTDFLYQLEWQEYLRRGVLTRMNVAFSRDTPRKVYVQHRMLQHGRDLYDWLQQGAHFYVCGDANRMAKDVHQALVDIHVAHGGLSPEAAAEAVAALQKAKRYQKDVY